MQSIIAKKKLYKYAKCNKPHQSHLYIMNRISTVIYYISNIYTRFYLFLESITKYPNEKSFFFSTVIIRPQNHRIFVWNHQHYTIVFCLNFKFKSIFMSMTFENRH